MSSISALDTHESKLLSDGSNTLAVYSPPKFPGGS